MSSKIEMKPLLSKHHLTSEHTIINHHGHSSYEQEIETNLRVILRRHSHLDKSKVRNLLEELENNLDLALNILQEEEQSGNKILEEKMVDFKKPHKMSQIQEIHCLKSSFLKLYRKVTDLRKENDQLTKKNQLYKSENERLKITRRIMISQEYNQSCFEENRDVC